MRRIAQDSEEGGEDTARFSSEDSLGIELTRVSSAPESPEDIRAKNESDREAMLRFQSELEALSENTGQSFWDDVRGLLPEDRVKGMNDRQIATARRLIGTRVRDLNTDNTGAALARRTVALESGAVAPEEAQAQYEREADEVERRYDRDAVLKAYDEYVASVRE